MLTENDVIDFLVLYLKNNGYTIEHISYTNQRGDDIVAKKEDKYLYIESKGQTSSDPKSKRYNLGFDSAQKKIHVAEAILKAMETKCKHPNENVGIAFPDDNRHRTVITNIFSLLKKLDIIVFFVNEDGKIDRLQ